MECPVALKREEAKQGEEEEKKQTAINEMLLQIEKSKAVCLNLDNIGLSLL